MKNILPILLGAALLPLAAQATSTSNVVGYTTQTLNNGFNLVGLTLHSPTDVASSLTGVTATDVTDTAVDFDATLTAGLTYILEIDGGAADGVIQEITSWSGNTLTTTDDLSAAGVVATDGYRLRVAPTLEELFGTTDTILKKGLSAAVADLVWIPDGVGGYTRYFVNNAGAWRNAAGGAAPNVPVIYTDGFFVQRKDVAVDFVLPGEVKTGNTTVAVVNGFNLSGTIYPAGTTLQNFGLDDDLKKGLSAAIADLVWVPDGLGGYTRYFLNTTSTWRNAAGGAAPADLPLTSAIFIERKDPAAMFTLTPPPSYASL